MRAFAAVFTREVAERRMVFLVGLGSGLLFLGAAALHGWNAPGSAEVRLLAGSVGGVALGAALALLYGGSVVAGETAERRISFYFSRPIPAAAIWAGKLLAAIFLSFSAGILVFLPGWLTGPAHARGIWGFEIDPGPALLLAAAAVVLAVLAAHAVVTVARLRSPWAFLDQALAIVLAVLLVRLLRTLVRDGILAGVAVGSDPHPALQVSAVLAVVVALALLVATLVQVGAGRIDTRRAHGAFSATLWGILGTILLGLALFTGWVASATARDLARTGGVVAPPRGPWVATDGPLRAGRGAGRFLFDPATGRSIRIHGYSAAFSQDGTRAAWGEPGLGFFGEGKRADVHLADLASGRAAETGLECDGGWSRIVLSPSGRTLALREGRALAAYDVSDPANPKQIAAFAIPEDGRAFAFVDEHTIRLFPRLLNAPRRGDLAPSALEITELSLLSKKSLVTGRLDRETLPYFRLTADGRFFVGSRRAGDDLQAPTTLILHDGRTGALVATLAEGLRMAQARFLTGGRTAVAGIGPAGARLLFFESDEGWGTPTRTIELGPAKRVVLGGEIAPGRVAVSLFPFEENPPVSASPRSAKLVAVDAASGAVTPLGEGLVPANRLGWWLDPVIPPAEAGAPWTSLFLDADGRLVRLDPATGARTIILGKR